MLTSRKGWMAAALLFAAVPAFQAEERIAADDFGRLRDLIRPHADESRWRQRNDGKDTPFAAGHKVDDLFFFVKADEGKSVELFVDEVTLFDAGRP
jgi:hypothetical protein